MNPDAHRIERIAAERAAGVYSEPGRQAFEQLVTSKRAGRSTALVRNVLIPQASGAELTGVGRNTPCPCGSRRKAKYCCMPIACDIRAQLFTPDE